jgi:hypothetical protein
MLTACGLPSQEQNGGSGLSKLAAVLLNEVAAWSLAVSSTNRSMSVIGMFQQLRIPRVGRTVAYSGSGEHSKLGYAKDCDLKKNRLETNPFAEEETLQHSWQANPTESLARWPPHYRMRGLLQNQEDAAPEEKALQGTQAPDFSATLVVRVPAQGLRPLF